MKILHTSDWHIGKSLENINRIEEQREFIDELCGIVEDEAIDMVIVAGDIFDTYAPSSAAEEVFYNAVDRLSGKGKRAVIVIAGNHDSPDRLCAASSIAYENGIILLGYPDSDAGIYKILNENIQIVDSGPGWLEISISSCKHNAVIITLPYPSESRLDQILSCVAEENDLQQAYSDKIADIVSNLSKNFRQDTVNLMTSHIFLLGGKESESERTIQVGGAMTVNVDALPTNAHYVALGHLHRPQQVKSAPVPTYYSGSPLAYSFSEVGQSKAVFIVNAVPGETAEVKQVHLSCGRPLVRWVAKEGISQAFKLCEQSKDMDAWIDLEIHTDRIITADEQSTLRALNPGIINIRPIILGDERQIEEYKNRETKKIDELFKEFYKYKVGIEPSDELMTTFFNTLNQEEEIDDEEFAQLIYDEEDDTVETKIS